MALFGSRANVKACLKLVDSVIEELGLDPREARLADTGSAVTWGMMKGSAEVLVRVHETADVPFIEVAAPVIAVPPSGGAELFRRLLEVNGCELSGVAFGIRGERILLAAARPITGLDKDELRDMLVRVGSYADQLDDLLATEFGAARHSDL